MKKLGAYQNWFQPHLWPQMLVVVKKYKNNKIIITFLQNVYKSLRVPSPYAKLTRSTMWELTHPQLLKGLKCEPKYKAAE